MAIGVTVQSKPKNQKKEVIIERVKALSESYTSMILFIVDNVCSNQLKKIRTLVKDKGELVMGKNTLFRKGLMASSQRTKFERILYQVTGNVGILFTNRDIKEMKEMVESVTEMAPVKANMIAQCDVVVAKGPTSLPPDKTSFFQALNISTMIVKANIQIMSDINLLKKGQKVGASEAALMKMLDMRPFSYMMQTKYVCDDGMAYPPEVLDLQQSDILDIFKNVVSDVACISLAASYPIKASIPHIIQNAMQELVAICVEADISNEYVDKLVQSAARLLLLLNR
ncbi:60S acidic ribosomal protein P0 [Thelohanellus kitauei]|uniref:Large ribosomal subunit protein uL10 n=1 Tax=Thelohanellus kitauei TaxID=669202 RepID=A0A0C2JL79_THEKT|nr:60S acidic ribosomal protein P0 [Thelohanellus kitauei]